MTIHPCRRCDGCGHIAGGYNWEMPWTRLAADSAVGPLPRLRARSCPDCGGTGALLELASSAFGETLPTRRGMPRNRYVQHVAARLRSQAVRAS